MTIILVTNLVQQARRLAARTMFLWNGEIIELDTHRSDVQRQRQGQADLRIRERDFWMKRSHVADAYQPT